MNTEKAGRNTDTCRIKAGFAMATTGATPVLPGFSYIESSLQGRVRPNLHSPQLALTPAFTV